MLRRSFITAPLALLTLLGASPASRAEDANALLGRWTAGRISTIQYKDSVTGAPAPTSGNNFAYEFKADGTYSFTGLMQNTMYNCTTSMFSNESGTWRAEGETIALKPEKNPYQMRNSCAPSSNREAPGKLINRSYRVKISRDGQRQKLELIAEDGGVQAFYRN